MSLKSLQSQAVALYRAVEKATRRLESDRISLGKLLILIRESMRAAQGGALRGKNGGSFCVWLADSGLNVGTAYNCMSLATGVDKNAGSASRKRIVFWQKFAQRIKAAPSNSAKVSLLRQAIDYLITTYGIDAKVTVK